MWGTGNPYTLLVGMQTGTSTTRAAYGSSTRTTELSHEDPVIVLKRGGIRLYLQKLQCTEQ